MLLTDWASSVNSQWGEDGIIWRCLDRLGILHNGTCFDVGASDGKECSNTLNLRDSFGWRRILVESDHALLDRQLSLATNVDVCVSAVLTASGERSIDRICVDWGVDELGFLSLDIDGNEYEVLRRMETRPRLICAEFNQSIPLHLSVMSPSIGCSLRAMVGLMATKGYHYIGSTQANAFFVGDEDVGLFEDVEQDPAYYFDESWLTYLVSTPYGGAVAFGPQLFGVQKRYVGEIDVITPEGVRTVVLDHRSTRPS